MRAGSRLDCAGTQCRRRRKRIWKPQMAAGHARTAGATAGTINGAERTRARAGRGPVPPAWSSLYVCGRGSEQKGDSASGSNSPGPGPLHRVPWISCLSSMSALLTQSWTDNDQNNLQQEKCETFYQSHDGIAACGTRLS